MPRENSESALQRAVLSSFMTEVSALKPGNVSQHADGHDMTAADFQRSAELTTPILCNPGLSVGERILEAVKMTQSQVGCNTNLGMLLLFAPLVQAAESASGSVSMLQAKLKQVLGSLDRTDTAHVFEAIRLASPGGLGQSDRFDVNAKADCKLLDAMREAQERDFVAKQYVTGFDDIFSTGYGCIKDYTQRWKCVKWAAVACYMTFLARYPDSHIRRKFGEQVAEVTRNKATPVAEQFKNNDNPENAVAALLEFDKELKNTNINPGTSADLTAASLLVYILIEK